MSSQPNPYVPNAELRTEMVCDHIRKELIEIAENLSDLEEWIDVVILGLDSAWRCGASPLEITNAIAEKQSKNESRMWPDWNTADPNKAIEHNRSAPAEQPGRPCQFTISSYSNSPKEKTGDIIKCYFHAWTNDGEAIVEDESGDVRMPVANRIRFTDRQTGDKDDG